MSSGDTRQIPAPEGVDKAVRKKNFKPDYALSENYCAPTRHQG
jgi:hypothetical protein